jgi:hypothetical protein
MIVAHERAIAEAIPILDVAARRLMRDLIVSPPVQVCEESLGAVSGQYGRVSRIVNGVRFRQQIIRGPAT